MKQLKIAYITSDKPNNKHAWSGTTYYIAQTLQKHIGDVDFLGPVNPGLTLLFCRILNKLSIALFNKRFDYRHSTIISNTYGRLFTKRLNNKKYDLIVTPGGSPYISRIKTSVPIILIADRTIAGAIDYHKSLSKLWKFSTKQSIETDKMAMQKSALTIFSSYWAASIAQKEYKILPKNISVIPFGANMDKLPEANNVSYKAPLNKECNLLFIGSSWADKGGPVALETFNELRMNGFNAKLTIVGCSIPSSVSHSGITHISFIDKNTSSGLNKLEELFSAAHFFILPTRFDCSPIVFCESAAFGLPVLAPLTGGLESLVKNGINGFLFDYNANEKAYSNKIIELLNEPDKYISLRKSSRALYESQLNWDKWAERFSSVVEKFIA